MNTHEEEIKASHLLEDAAEKAALLITEAAKKAAILPKEAAEKAALLVKHATETAALLPKDAAAKAALLPKDAAEKAARLPKVAAEKAALLPKDAAKKAILLLKDAAAEAALLPKDALEKSTLLFNNAAENALHLLKEESESFTEKKNKFLDIAAHELRNPIASASLLLQVIEKQIEKGQPLDVNIISRLRAPIDRLTRLVVDLLDMSRLERGLLAPVFVQTDINSLISECIEEFQIQAPKRTFIFHKPEKPNEIILDPLRINQVLTNILDNAVKYTSKGPIEVILNDMPDIIRVSIIDHGGGITKEQQEVLFNAFSRGSLNEIVMPGGLGLGLSICRAIIDLHNGKIGVISKEGQGSTFYFELPKKNINI